MASCLVTIGGTTGKLKLQFDLGSNKNVLYTSVGDIVYIPDTATNITYLTLSGDATASSLCATITAFPRNCFKLVWEQVDGGTITSHFDKLIVGSSEYTFSPELLASSQSILDLSSQINGFDPILKSMSFKVDYLPGNLLQSTLIISLTSSDVPELRIKTANNNYLYLIGVATPNCEPSGYVVLNTCDNYIPN